MLGRLLDDLTIAVLNLTIAVLNWKSLVAIVSHCFFDIRQTVVTDARIRRPVKLQQQ